MLDELDVRASVPLSGRVAVASRHPAIERGRTRLERR
jgi:hypothetical protein